MLIRSYAGTGRIPYQYTPFIRSFLAKAYFGIEKTSRLLHRLKGEPNLRLLCGCTDVPGKATFSRALAFLSEQGILEQTLDGIVSMTHKDLVVYHVNRDSLGRNRPGMRGGCKKNSEGNVSFWKGYKLHLDVSDTGFPLTAVVMGANVHDSQLAIPMEQLTEMKVPFCYSLMDSTYDSKTIDEYIGGVGVYQ
jgi:hypothetical protein